MNSLNDIINAIHHDTNVSLGSSRREHLQLRESKKSKQYYNKDPLIFDIETTSYRDDQDQKRACIVSFSLVYKRIETLGRRWREFYKTIDSIFDGLRRDVVQIVYVHNLSYEAAFILKTLNEQYTIDHILANSERKIIAFNVQKPGRGVIQFRCSYLLSQESLSHIGDRLKFPKSKNWDYTLQRNSLTPLSPLEVEYNIQDCRVVQKYIEGERERVGGNIYDIPYTSTGYVRNEFKNTFKQYPYIQNIISKFKMAQAEFELIQRAYCGGYTHAAPRHVGKVLKNVHSFDFNSSYPAVMCSERFPCELSHTYIKAGIDDIEREAAQGRAVVCDVYFRNLRAKRGAPDYYISAYKSRQNDERVCNVNIRGEFQIYNGRVITCEGVLKTSITELDWGIIRNVYEWDNVIFTNVHVYKKEYLPKEYIELILTFYKNKNTLKGVEGHEIDYMNSKKLLNSIYGMCVMNPLKDTFEIDANGDLTPTQKGGNELEEYNNSSARYLNYIWGVYVSSYARANLWTGILECGADFVYSDTDSIKILNANKHVEYINRYNTNQSTKFYDAMKTLDINKDLYIYNGFRVLGLWDADGAYDMFKTLGAKRYLTKANGEFHLTVSGLKKETINFLKETGDPFKVFSNGLHIPAEKTNKLTHTYIDGFNGKHIDYLGNVCEVLERGGVNLEPAPFDLSTTLLLKIIVEEAERDEILQS